MADEIELKLSVDPQRLSGLSRARWLSRYGGGAGDEARLVSVYYDSDDLKLRARRAMLRIREGDGARVQTFKAGAPGKGSGSALGRMECEGPVSLPVPQLSRLPRKIRKRFGLEKLGPKLKPVFETTVARTTVPLNYQGSTLELAIDRGEIKTGRKRAPISEIEIELKRGRPEAVIALGRELAKKLDAAYGPASKAERGYALREGETDCPVFAEPIALDAAMKAGAAFQAIAMACLHHFARNRDAVIAGHGEAIHQMRVGLRRLRAAISLFKEMLRGPETEAIKASLKWLTEELGPARDMDVLAGKGIASLVDEGAEALGDAVPVLKADLEARRDRGFARAKAAVDSERFRKLVLDLVFWINGGRWAHSHVALTRSRRAMPARRFAAQELTRRVKKICKRVGKVEELSPRQRHKLRIAVKKMRYATGFFESLFWDRAKRIAEFRGALKALQSALGDLNDIQVHEKLAADFAGAGHRGPRAVPEAFAMGVLAGTERAKRAGLLKSARRGGKRLKHARGYWG